MSFLKKILGRPRWEEVADDPDDMVPVWDSPQAAPPVVSQPAPPSTPPPVPQAAPAAPVSSAPRPTFQPAAAPAAPASSAPRPTFQPGAAPGGTAAPPTFQPGAAPGAAVGGATPPPVPVSEPAVPSIKRAPGTREVILDTIDDNDQEMPEEFRGCKVIEQTGPDGKARVVYRGPDGFTVDEDAATILIDAYREELASLRPKASTPQISGGYTAAPAAPAPVEPRLFGSVPSSAPAPVVEEVIDELGFGDDLPPELRGAKFIRHRDEFVYKTRAGQTLSKDMAEGMMERWERDARERPEARAAVRSSVPSAPWAVPGAAPAPSTAPPPTFSPAPSAPPPAPPVASAPAPAPTFTPAPAPTFTPAPAPTFTPAPAPTFTPAPAPSAAPAAPATPAITPPPRKRRAPEPAYESAPAPAPVAQTVRPGDRDSSDSIGEALQSAAAMLAVPTLETELDTPAVAAARHQADRLRTMALDDDEQVFSLQLRQERLEQSVSSEISRRRTKHRFEHLLSLSEKARDTLIDAWKSSGDRPLRDAAKDLDQDMLVLGLFNPMTLRDIDPGEFLSVARLRLSERRRSIVSSELARRVAEEVPAALHTFLMTRAFVDRVGDAAATTGSAEEALRGVMEERLAEALREVIHEVTRRHGIWLPQLEERLMTKMRSLTDGLIRLASNS